MLKDLGTDGDAWDNLKGTDTGKNLVINKTGITSTWTQDNAIYKDGNQTTNNMPLVYPIVSYGDFNPSVKTTQYNYYIAHLNKLVLMQIKKVIMGLTVVVLIMVIQNLL